MILSSLSSHFWPFTEEHPQDLAVRYAENADRTTDCADNADGNCEGSRYRLRGMQAARLPLQLYLTAAPRFQIEYGGFRLVRIFSLAERAQNRPLIVASDSS